jgi:hypothetical protein
MIRDLRISAGALAARDRCQRMFALQYGERLYWPGPERETGPEVARGRLFHLLVQRHRLGLAVDPPPEVADLWGRFLESPFAEPAGPPSTDSPVRVWTEQELKVLVDPPPPRMAPKGWVATRNNRVPFVVRFDEIRLSGDDWLILDWKTGAVRPEALGASWQTRLYRFALAKAGRFLRVGDRSPGTGHAPPPPDPDRITLVYWLVADGMPLEFRYSAGEFEQDARLFCDVAQAARTPLAALPGPDDPEACRACRFDSYCHPRPRVAPIALPQPVPQFVP